MAHTTNYNWETPDDTDLVKDGAAAIRTLGSSVDTTTKALNPSTTLGDIEYRSATANTNTRLAIGTTGQVLTVSGGVPAWATSDDANAIQNAIVDAKGDLISATAADTPARLAVGANGTVLTADSAETTGLKWATPASGGGMTLLSTTSLTGSTVDISSIDQTYTDLVAVISDVYMDNDTGTFSIRFNTISTGNYTFNTTKCNASYATLNFGHSETAYDISGKTDETTGRFKLAGMITMPRYASATNKFATHQTLSSPDGSAANVNFGVCNFQTTSGISTITFRLSAGTFSGGTVYLYGVK
jgi:hypothetical protein